MDAQRAAEIQVVLEGIRLPASRDELIAYARSNGPEFVPDLEALPRREFDRLDVVGELLMLDPSAPTADHRSPRPESGKPPGGADYLQPFPADTGRVLEGAPRDNPPEKAIERASEVQKEQKAAQGG